MKILAIETSCDDTAIAILEIKHARLNALAFVGGLFKPSFKVLTNVVSSQQIHQNYGGVFPMMAKREHQKNLIPVLTEALKEAELLKEISPSLRAPARLDARYNSPKRIYPVFGPARGNLDTLKKIFEKENNLFEDVKKFLETYEKPDVDVIAVTHGPGLEPCLWVGVNFAKALSYIWGLPIIPVNHIEAHILVNFLQNPNIALPALALVVSGGHTQLILVKKVPARQNALAFVGGNYQIIGETQDDAAGECFDKTARLLGLGYPGGPIISNIASKITKSSIHLPRPMLNSKDYNFSFSGLKTAVLYKLRDTDEKIKTSKEFVNQMCFEVQNAICEVLIKKTLAAAKEYKVKTIILGGGVSANQELRKQFTQKANEHNLAIIFPDPKLSTDNALMIAITAYFHKNKKVSWEKLMAHGNLRIG